MRAFHIDDGGNITKAGQLLTLSNDFPYPWFSDDIRDLCIDMFDGEGVAHFGCNFFDSVPFSNVGLLRTLLIEQCFEAVRKKHYPQYPSRLQSLFVCTSRENVKLWRNKVPSLKNGQLWLVEGEQGFLANAALLVASHDEADQEYFDPALARRMALAYWGTGKLLGATSDQHSANGREMALGKNDRYMAELGIDFGERSEAEILLKYPVNILRRA